MRRRGWLVDVLLAALLAAVTAALAAGALLDLDLWARDWVDAHRPRPAHLAALALNWFGQGSALLGLAALVAVWLARRSHSVRPILPVAAAYAGLYLVIGPIKLLTDRAAPHKPPGVAHREELFSGGLSYPSGHVANTIVWYGVLVLLLGAALPVALRRAVRIVPPAIVAVTTTYLGYHWLTDTVAGVLAGLLVDRALHRIDWDAFPLHRLPGAHRLVDRGWAGPMR